MNDMEEKPLRIAVAGVGHLGQHHARLSYELPFLQLAGIADPDQERGEKIAGEYQVPWVASVDELPDEVEALAVVTPTIDHWETSRKALERGWHVFVEKPITRTVEEGQLLVDYTRQRGKVLQVGHIERFNSAVLEVVNHLREPRFIECHRLGPLAPRVKDIGVVKDLMIHDLDLVLSLVNSEVESVEAVGVAVLTLHEDIANARVRFKNGCIANFTVSRVSPEQMRKIRFFQSDAYFSLDYQKHCLESYYKITPPSGGMPSIERKLHQMEGGNALARELAAFARSVREGALPAVSGEDGLKALELAEEISRQIHNAWL